MLKIYLLLLTLFTIPTLLSSPAMAHASHCENTELDEVMKEMKANFKAYIKAYNSNDNPEMQRQLDKLILSSNKAKERIPLKLLGHNTRSVKAVEDLAPSQQMEHKGYIQGMDDLLAMFDKLKIAQSKKEKKALFSMIKKHTKKSHKEFRKNCD